MYNKKSGCVKLVSQLNQTMHIVSSTEFCLIKYYNFNFINIPNKLINLK